ncbi:GNAT family N-acetyltransferase [Candidatus Bathyarchaeota archaeon]|nr:GNAT family N-acetyltransferase [Candidatus Bathyarchaeota archaeon]
MDCPLIREAKIEDVSFIVDMIRSGSREGAFHRAPSQTLSTEEQMRGFRKYAFEDRPNGYAILIYQIGDAIAGYVDYQVEKGVARILGIFVYKTRRRRGIGKELMERILNDLTKKGCHKVRLKVFSENRGALEFYRNLGFSREGFLHKDEDKKDIFIVGKLL